MSTVFLRALFGSRIGTGFVTTAQLNAEANTRALADTNLDNTKADLAGDTFTGNIIVPTGTLANHAVNKGQVDTDLGLKANKSGDTFTGNIVIPDGTIAGHGVNKGQLDTKANATHTHVRADITDLTEFVEVNSIPIGMPFPQWFESDASAVVTKYPTRFVKLSKNLEGAYNSGKLGVSSAITTDETTFYTAMISDVASPLNGQSVTLINSVENTTGGVSAQPTFLGAGETAQTKLVNRMQGFKLVQGVNPPDNMFVNVGSDSLVMQHASSDIYPVTDTINGTPRLGKTTRPDTVTAVWYMRIK